MRGVAAACLLLVAGEDMAAGRQASPAGQAITVSLAGRAIQPGEVIRVDVACSCSTSPRTTIADVPLPLARAGDGHWQGLFGIDLNTAPGPITLAVQSADDIAATRTVTVQVTPKRFRTRTLRVEPKYVEPPADVVARILAEAAQLETLFNTVTPRAWNGRFALPLPTGPTPNFGSRSVFNGMPRNPHAGVDFGSAAGTPVTAPAGGTVTLAADLYFTGNTVIVNHGDGLHSLFAHLSSFAVTAGAPVVVGTPLGTVGATGRATGPHLHWSVRLNGARVDPLSLMAATNDAEVTSLGEYGVAGTGIVDARR